MLLNYPKASACEFSGKPLTGRVGGARLSGNHGGTARITNWKSYRRSCLMGGDELARRRVLASEFASEAAATAGWWK